MYCPNCSQEQLADDVRFCSRCGLPLADTALVLAGGGVHPASVPEAAGTRPRRGAGVRTGVKHGAFLILLAIIFMPVAMMIAKELGIRPAFFIIASFSVLALGVSRIAFALMFGERDEASAAAAAAGRPQRLDAVSPAAALPAPNTNPLGDFAASPRRRSWRDSAELEPASVTDGTTRML